MATATATTATATAATATAVPRVDIKAIPGRGPAEEHPPATPRSRPEAAPPGSRRGHGPAPLSCSCSRSRPRAAAAAGCRGQGSAPGPDPGGPRGRAPPAPAHGLAAAGRGARLRRLPHRRAVGAECRPLHRGDGREALPGAAGRPLAHGAGAPQAPVPGARPDPPPWQQHPQQQGRSPAAPAGGESGAERARAGAAVPAGGPGRGGRHGVRGGRLGHRQPQRAPARQALPGGAAGAEPRRLQPPHAPRPHHHPQHDVHRLPQEGHLQGRLRRPPGLQRGGRGGGHSRLPGLRQLQETRHLHPHRPVRRLDRRRHGLRGRAGRRALSRPRRSPPASRRPQPPRRAGPGGGEGRAGARGAWPRPRSTGMERGRGGGEPAPARARAAGFAECAPNAGCASAIKRRRFLHAELLRGQGRAGRGDGAGT